jgi:hypothetical protein
MDAAARVFGRGLDCGARRRSDQRERDGHRPPPAVTTMRQERSGDVVGVPFERGGDLQYLGLGRNDARDAVALNHSGQQSTDASCSAEAETATGRDRRAHPQRTMSGQPSKRDQRGMMLVDRSRLAGLAVDEADFEMEVESEAESVECGAEIGR